MKSLAIDDQILTPLHHQVYVVLRQQISEEVYPSDEPMPPEHELSRLFNVSRITIRRALDRLEMEGLVYRRRGKGTFAQPKHQPPPIQANLKGIFENLLAMGLKTKVKLVEFSYVPASPIVANELQIPVNSVVQKAVRVRWHDGRPFSHLTTYVPEDIGRSYDRSELAEKPLLFLLERSGVRVTTAKQTISAKLADSIVAPLLDVEPGAAMLWVRRVVQDEKNRPIEYLNAIYRPDIYEYQMSMSRITKSRSKLWAPDAVP
jgi:GntR family transcriptional regulator